MANERVKLIKFNSGSALDRKIDFIQQALQAPARAEAVRRAIEIASNVVQAQQEGAKVLLRSPDGKETIWLLIT